MNLINDAQDQLQQAIEQYETHRNVEQAFELCEIAIQLDPNYADAHNFRGILLEELNKPINAVGAYRKAIKLDPEFQEARDNLEALKAQYSGANPLVTVAVVRTLGQAYPLKARLEAEGLKVVIPDEEYIIFRKNELGDDDEIHLLVREDEAELARQIIKKEPELLEEDPEFVDDEGQPIVVEQQELEEEFETIEVQVGAEISCKWCGSYKVKQTLPLPFIPRKWKCQDCGQVWE